MESRVKSLQQNSRFALALKALRELGPRQLGLYAWYKLLLHSGYFRKRASQAGRRRTMDARRDIAILHLPSRDEVLSCIDDEGLSRLLSEADEIVDGQVRLFGGDPVPLVLSPPGELYHWTDYELRREGVWGKEGTGDLKFIWEPARFGWAFTLGRAYFLTGDQRYPESFWRYFEIFQEDNPVNMGPNWISAQEVALRLIAFVFAAQIFSDSSHSTAHRTTHLATAIARHAARIPPTLIYARAQNNNHLLSEAAGLITASLAMPDHPDASRWSRLGWKWFNRGLETQIAADGTYMQHSTNYHRLMLQLALWICAIQQSIGSQFGNLGEPATRNLQRATHWLLSLIDSKSGRVPNLGPNDGAYILPLSVLPFHDYRPVLQAASQAFLGELAFDPGPWDEMAIWLCCDGTFQVSGGKANSLHPENWKMTQAPLRSTLHARQSWAYLRAAKFHDRPGHADQLHLDLWWGGLNVALDAGTYLYNAEPPWDNALTHTAVHNTVMIDNCEQMSRAGRFLYLDWAQAEWVRESDDQITAWHNGYDGLGLTHQRTVIQNSSHSWEVRDSITTQTWAKLLRSQNRSQKSSRQENKFWSAHSVESFFTRIHWLFPDWPWEIDFNDELDPLNYVLSLHSPHGSIMVTLSFDGSDLSHLGQIEVGVVRAGELLYGNTKPSPIEGWFSPTYATKRPALSFSLMLPSLNERMFLTKFEFPEI